MVLIHGVVAIITTSIVSFLYLVEIECFEKQCPEKIHVICFHRKL